MRIPFLFLLWTSLVAGSRLAAAQTLDLQFRPAEVYKTGGMPGTIKALALQADGRIIVGGEFSEINGWNSPNVARLWPSGEADTTFRASAIGLAGGELMALGVEANGRVILGGSFQSVNGNPRPGVARLLADGRLDASFIVGLQSGVPRPVVRAIQVQPDGKIVLGGSFVAVPSSGAPSPQVVRLLSSGIIDPTFTAAVPFSGQVGALLLLPTGELLVAGNIFSGQLELVRRLRANGSLDPTFSTVLANQVTAGMGSTMVPVAGGGFMLGGSFNSSNAQTAANVTRLRANGTTDPGFVSSLPNNQDRDQVPALAVEADGSVLVAVLPTPISGGPYLRRLLPTGQPDFSYFGAGKPAPDDKVLALLRQPDGRLLVGGSFQHLLGRPLLALARLLETSVTATRRPAGLQPATELWPVPVGPQGLHLRLDAAAAARQVQLLDLTGRAILTQAVTSAELVLPTAGLRPGVYLLRVSYATGPVTRRVVIE